MVRLVDFLLVLALATGVASAAPKVFSDPRQAIEDAKKGEKLIVFMMVDVKDFRAEGAALEELILGELKDLGDEFVIVRCNETSEMHRKMFTDRFEKDLSKAPVVVVSNAKGEEVTGCYGVKADIYRKMLTLSRIKSGKVTDEDELVAMRVELLEDENEEELVDSIFGIMLSDLKGKRVQMTDVREWTYKSGEKFRAALLAGKGEYGLFINAEGEEMEVKFVDLSPADIEFLKTVLTEKNPEETAGE